MSQPSADWQEWYEGAYPQLSGQGIWLRGGEIGTIDNREWDCRPFRVLFARLSTYRDTVESWTHGELYRIAETTPGVFPDLSYLPPPKDAAIFDRDKVPWLIGTTTKKGPGAFDLIGLSNALVQEMINVPVVLRRSGIPLSRPERMSRDDLPLVILGGANAMAACPLALESGWVDGVFAGGGAEQIRRLLEICRDSKAARREKGEILELLETVAGFVFRPGRGPVSVPSCPTGAFSFSGLGPVPHDG